MFQLCRSILVPGDFRMAMQAYITAASLFNVNYHPTVKDVGQFFWLGARLPLSKGEKLLAPVRKLIEMVELRELLP